MRAPFLFGLFACAAVASAQFTELLVLKQSRTFTSAALSQHNLPTYVAGVPNITAAFGAGLFTPSLPLFGAAPLVISYSVLCSTCLQATD